MNKNIALAAVAALVVGFTSLRFLIAWMGSSTDTSDIIMANTTIRVGQPDRVWISVTALFLGLAMLVVANVILWKMNKRGGRR